jgi:chromosome segregation ATPase
MTEQYEAFCDASYYDMWCVRRIGERTFGQGFHVLDEKSALELKGELEALAAELAEVKQDRDLWNQSEATCEAQYAKLAAERDAARQSAISNRKALRDERDENARLTALVHQLGENAAKAAREYAEGMASARNKALEEAAAVCDEVQDSMKYEGPDFGASISAKKIRAIKGAAAHD